jgi:hypothetical protein
VKLCECGCGNPTPIAPVTRRDKGWVKGQPLRFVCRHGNRTPIGTRRIKPRGYVQIKVGLGGREWEYEHRVVWEAAHGPIPKGGTIHHLNEDKADNRLENLELCESNADHFRRFHAHMAAENGRRSAAKNRGRPRSAEHCAKLSAARTGKKYPNASAAIRALWARRRAAMSSGGTDA